MQPHAQDPCTEFEAAVVRSFEFLETEFAFLRRSSRPQKYTEMIIYENPELYVVLSYGPPAYEPEMSFGRRGVDDVPGAYSFHPGDLVQLDCCKSWNWKKENGNAIPSWVAELARLLASCGAQCLTGNPAVFGQMRARRDKLIEDWNRTEHIKRVRNKIASAWAAKDYEGIIDLYSAIDDLSELDQKRLHFAKTHV